MTIRNIVALRGQHARLTSIPLLLAAALAVATHPVEAGEPPGHTEFNDMDTDGDMRLSAAEAAFHPHLKDNFKEADGDGDGYISEREFALSVPAVNKGRPTESWFTQPGHDPE